MRSAALLVAAGTVVVAGGLLRTYHDALPVPLPVLGPFGGVLGWAFAAALAAHVAGRRRDADLLHRNLPAPAARPPGALTASQALPLVVVVLGEKWLTTAVIGPRLVRGTDAHGDALYRLESGLALLAAALVLLPVLRQSRARIASYMGAARVRRAGVNVLLAFAVIGGTLALTALLPRAGWPLPAARPPLLAAAAQAVLGVAEEFWFRGVVQTAFVWLLIESGLPDTRGPRLLGIAVVSIGFTLEHLDGSVAAGTELRQLLFVFAMSCAFGVLLEVSRNLYLPAAGHVVMNLLLVGALPVPRTADGIAYVAPATAGALFVTLLLVGVVVAHHRHRAA